MSQPTSSAPDSGAAATEADVIAAAVLSCPAVVSLYAGGLPQVATYLPGRRVGGIRLDERTVEVSVVSRYGVPLPDVATQIRSAVSAHAPGRAIDVRIADVRTPYDQPDDDDEQQAALPADTS